MFFITIYMRKIARSRSLTTYEARQCSISDAHAHIHVSLQTTRYRFDMYNVCTVIADPLTEETNTSTKSQTIWRIQKQTDRLNEKKTWVRVIAVKQMQKKQEYHAAESIAIEN